MSTTEAAADAARQELGAEFEGEFVAPEDSGYDEARALFNAMIDKRPAVIARCASRKDVARVIAFARAKAITRATSFREAQRAITAGRLSIIALNSARASS